MTLLARCVYILTVIVFITLLYLLAESDPSPWQQAFGLALVATICGWMIYVGRLIESAEKESK